MPRRWERPGVGAEPQTLGYELGGGWRPGRLRFREVGAGGWARGGGGVWEMAGMKDLDPCMRRVRVLGSQW